MLKKRVDLIKPGVFGEVAAADNMRGIYDSYNEVIVTNKIPVDFAFIGDSITQMWDIQAYFGQNGNHIVNRGISGDKTQYILKRFEADVVQLHPKYVVIMAGVNNTWVLDAWNSSDRKKPDRIEQETIKDLSMMVQLSKRVGIEPIICSILPTCKGIPCYSFFPMVDNANNSTEQRNQLIFNINQQLKNLSVNEGFIYIDYHSNLVEEDRITLRSELADDGLHPHVLGYNIMSNILKNDLKLKGIEI